MYSSGQGIEFVCNLQADKVQERDYYLNADEGLEVLSKQNGSTMLSKPSQSGSLPSTYQNASCTRVSSAKRVL